MSNQDLNKILLVVNQAVYASKGRYLKDKEEKVLIGSLNGLTYKEIAKKYNYVSSTLARDVGPKLWQILTDVCGEQVTKTNLNGAIRRLVESFPSSRVDHKFGKILKALMQLLNY